ncbi:MAG: murein L,D-transpeptidase catalytic domain-containing protein [Parabacteroides gordonii]|uniref:murein L,D-transpeptidase catalytic domain-containing protein n=1 Tax=Parabacteroides gordonii TaxID=574930 RepID=UPI003A8AB0D0
MNTISQTLIILILSLTFITCNANNKENGKGQDPKDSKEEVAERQTLLSRLKAKADTAKLFCKQKGLSTDYCFLVDFSIHSGKKRFFVWDFAKDSIKYESLCCHGYGKKSTTSKPVFSNVEGSYCSSLGKYKTGARSYSQYGINVHYKLHGFDKTNSNAFKRWVVLHSHTPVPDYEIYPNHLPLGWSQGCPVINNEIMRKVDTLLKNSKKPILLWVYI